MRQAFILLFAMIMLITCFGCVGYYDRDNRGYGEHREYDRDLDRGEHRDRDRDHDRDPGDRDRGDNDSRERGH